MKKKISINILEHINNFIEAKFGLYFPKERYNDVMRSLSNASKQKGIDVEKYVDLIISNKLSSQDLKDLVTFLTIGETYFFRDKKLFEIMRRKIIPNIINSRRYSSRSLKIWSAGCSSGEEAYSIAILIKELIPDYENWDIKIIATDINQNSLSKARKAIYSEWSFRGVDSNIRDKYFDNIDDMNFKLNDSIVKLVKFDTLNLADHNYVLDKEVINSVDIIFCRNVLMYFSKYQAHEIIKRFYNTIIDGGWLVGTPSESLYFNDTFFKPINIDGRFLYNKDIKENRLTNTINWDIETKNSIKWNKIATDYAKLEYNNVATKKMSLPLVEDIDTYEKQELDKSHKEHIKEFESLSRSFANEGKLDDALEYCKKAIDEDKINPVYYHLLAGIQQEQGNISEAISSLKKAIYLDSQFIMAYFDLGNLNLKEKKLKDAFKNFENVHTLLRNYNEDDIVPYSEGLNVGILKQIIENINYRGDFNGKV